MLGIHTIERIKSIVLSAVATAAALFVHIFIYPHLCFLLAKIVTSTLKTNTRFAFMKFIFQL